MEDESSISISSSVSTGTVSNKKPSARTEKGVHKVVDHTVKEQAAALLYSCMAILESDDEQVKSEFRAVATPKIDEIVRNFGLDTARIKAQGERVANSIISRRGRHQKVLEIEGDLATLGALAYKMREELMNDVTLQDMDVINMGDANIDLNGQRTTRGGMQSKRAREEDEMENAAVELLAKVKRLGTERVKRDGSRPRSLG